MKELSIVKQMVADGQVSQEVAEKYFPELHESDDEKIISAIRKAIEAKVENLGNGVTRTACLAWLEKQDKCETVCHRSHQDANHPNGCIVLEDFNAGEGFYKVHLDYLSRKQVEVIEEMVRTWNNDSKAPDEDIKSCIGMCLTDANEQRFKDYNTSLKDCLAWLEMQGGQEEPQVYETEDGEIITYSETDGYKVVEPRFKVGDWIVTPKNKVIQITGIEGTCYTFDNTSHYWEIYYCDQECHLWTISDAKDGDVLADEDNNIGIYQGKVDDVDWHSCIYLGCNNNLYDVGYHIIKNTKPATKEQRDLLFKKMKEAGYEWNAEELRLDKAEPKFHEGDWTVSKLDGKARQISEVHFDEYNSYYVVDGKDVNLEEYDRLHHLWTIKDVKDGDVLQLGGVTAIFKEYIGYGNCKCYCSVFDGEFEIPSQDDDDNRYGCIDAAPATKEQRDKLEKAMADAGYTFDFEKKELKKTEQTPAWSEEDEKRLAELSSILEIGGNFAISDWLKSLKERYAWKPSDEQIEALEHFVRSIGESGFASPYDSGTALVYSLLGQLKKLREE